MKLELDEAQLKSIVSEAILKLFDDKKRDAIVAEAVSYLLTPKRVDSYTSKTQTPLQEAFEGAMHGVAWSVVKDLLANDDEIRLQLRTIASAAMTRALAKDELVEKMADSFASLFAGQLRER